MLQISKPSLSSTTPPSPEGDSLQPHQHKEAAAAAHNKHKEEADTVAPNQHKEEADAAVLNQHDQNDQNKEEADTVAPDQHEEVAATKVEAAANKKHQEQPPHNAPPPSNGSAWCSSSTQAAANHLPVQGVDDNDPGFKIVAVIYAANANRHNKRDDAERSQPTQSTDALADPQPKRQHKHNHFL